MNKEDHVGLSEKLMVLYEKAPIPTAILDIDYKIVWANDAAKKVSPMFTMPDGMFLMLPAFFLDNLLSCKLVPTVDNPVEIPIIFTNRNIIIMAVEEKGINKNYLVQYTEQESLGSALKPEGSEKLVSAFSNQFRAPLSVIFSALSALRTNPVLDDYPNISEYLQTINENSYQILKSSINVTDYIRRQTNSVFLQKSYVDIGQLISELCNAANIVTASAGLHIECDAEKNIYLLCDQEKITNAFLQLISNSCRHAKNSSEVFITVKQKEGKVIVTVKDDGPGVPLQIQEMIFDPFYSYSADGEPFAGFGLGLSLFKETVAAHGGVVTFVSDEEKGTTVAFTLPITQGEDKILSAPKKVTDYLYDRFSPVYVQLCDSCSPPKA